MNSFIHLHTCNLGKPLQKKNNLNRISGNEMYFYCILGGQIPQTFRCIPVDSSSFLDTLTYQELETTT